MSTSENGSELAKQLPPWMPKDPESGNFRLLDVIGLAFDRLDEDIETANRATSVQHADTIAQLEELAKIVDLIPQRGEGKEKYRARVFAEFQLVTNEATPAEIILNAANILNVDPERIRYEELDEPGVILLRVPASAVDSLSVSEEEFAQIINRLVAAGVRVDTLKTGTFTYISESDYEDSSFVHESERGYDGLDTNGEPKESGGTYSGLID